MPPERARASLTWPAYFRALGNREIHVVNVRQPRYFGGVSRALVHESIENWKAYLRWQLVHSFATTLGTATVREDADFYRRQLQGVAVADARWRRT